jgi:rSAM/selenodomain-associated transferase 2
MSVDISIIIPVLNEQAQINRAIKRIYRQSFSGAVEVIVVDGSQTCETIKNIKNQNVIKINSRPGRGLQMNAGAMSASGDILLFLHCDTALSENALEAIGTVMQDQAFKGGAFDLHIDGKSFVYRMIEKTASLRSRLTKLPYGDQAIFIRKDYFFDIGQYSHIPIMEDVDLMQRIKIAQGKIKFLKLKTSTSPRRWETEGKLYCTLRNWILISLFLLGVKPEKLAAYYKNKSV